MVLVMGDRFVRSIHVMVVVKYGRPGLKKKHFVDFWCALRFCMAAAC